MIITDEMLRKAAWEAGCAMIRSLPDVSDYDYEFSKSYRRKMARLIWRTNHRGMYKTLKYAASFLIMLLATASLFLTFNVEARAGVLDWFRDRVVNFYNYVFIGETDDIELCSYRLEWVPDGYEYLTVHKSANMETVIYTDGEEKLLQFSVVVGSYENNMAFLGEGKYKQECMVLGKSYVEVYFSESEENSNMVVWKDNKKNALFCVSGYLSEEDLIKIAQNVTAEKNS